MGKSQELNLVSGQTCCFSPRLNPCWKIQVYLGQQELDGSEEFQGRLWMLHFGCKSWFSPGNGNITKFGCSHLGAFPLLGHSGVPFPTWKTGNGNSWSCFDHGVEEKLVQARD